MSSSAEKFITVKGARVNNLKNIDVKIPRNKLVVITGLSGSGKTSLAFDTLYADGQRRYVESLSSYARQFLGRMAKPEVDLIDGISPAIAIEQKVNTRNPRSTVGTSTEIYDYLKLLFSRIGKTISPVSGKEVKRHSVTDVVNFISGLPESTKVIITSKFFDEGKTPAEQVELYIHQGFSRVFKDGEILQLTEIQTTKLKNLNKFHLVIDRLTSKNDEDFKSRAADSVQTAFYEGRGECQVWYFLEEAWKIQSFSNRFEMDGIDFEEPTVNFFSFNNPFGACKRCEGYGTIIGIDPDLVIPDKSKSIYEGAISCWKGEKLGEWNNNLIFSSPKFNFPIHRPYYLLTEAEKNLLWTGNQYFDGINRFFEEVEENSYKIQYRVLLSRYRGKTTCPDCLGSRLRKDATYVKVDGKSITDILLMNVKQALEFFKTLNLSENDLKISERIVVEIMTRLQTLDDVGLSYLSLNRKSNSLSGGESQRINLATSLGSNLVGSMYILDEPSIGLHPRDSQRLIEVLKRLRDSGNTVIVVEHEEEMMKAADYIIDIGPLSGRNGGEVVFSGTYSEMVATSKTLTGKYLSGVMEIPVPQLRRSWRDKVRIEGALENNLKNLNVSVPLGVITVVTGVSGSGKTSLIKGILYPALKTEKGEGVETKGRYSSISGDLSSISSVEMVDQNPIGRSSRSNPVTYIKAFDEIRAIFANQKLAKLRNLKPGYFSFNVEGGRCEMCQGEGNVNIEMQFMADISLTCEHCNGKRYKPETLEITYFDKSIADVLDMTVNEAIDFFKKDNNSMAQKVVARLQVLDDVGLGYIQLGQSSSTLSGGEAQRIKLAYHLTEGNKSGGGVFIFDEPTTGLHIHDINRLYMALNELVKKGNTVIIIEHNQELIKCADWVIDLGPDGGDAGGEIVFQGVPEDLINESKSFTAKFLKEKIK